MSDNTPGLVYYSASGAWSPKDCPPSTEHVPYCSDKWTPAIAGLAEWNATIEKVLLEKEMLLKFNEAKPSSSR